VEELVRQRWVHLCTGSTREAALIRKELFDAGVEIADVAEGTRWYADGWVPKP
jgi:hypothetical protein